MLLFLSTAKGCGNRGNDRVLWLFVKATPSFSLAIVGHDSGAAARPRRNPAALESSSTPEIRRPENQRNAQDGQVQPGAPTLKWQNPHRYGTSEYATRRTNRQQLPTADKRFAPRAGHP